MNYYDRELDKKKALTIISIFLIIVSIFCVSIGILKTNATDKIELTTHNYDKSSWKYEIEDKSIVKLYDKKVIGGPIDITNDKDVKEIFVFKPVKPGSTIIRFVYTNYDNGSYTDVKKYTASVDKYFNLSLNEIK